MAMFAASRAVTRLWKAVSRASQSASVASAPPYDRLKRSTTLYSNASPRSRAHFMRIFVLRHDSCWRRRWTSFTVCPVYVNPYSFESRVMFVYW